MSADLRITVDLRNWRKVYFYFCNNIREDYKFTLSNEINEYYEIAWIGSSNRYETTI